jgi:hypothetical protein
VIYVELSKEYHSSSVQLRSEGLKPLDVRTDSPNHIKLLVKVNQGKIVFLKGKRYLVRIFFKQERE